MWLFAFSLYFFKVVKLIVSQATKHGGPGMPQRLLIKDVTHRNALHLAVQSKNVDTVEFVLRTWDKETSKLKCLNPPGALDND